MAIVATNKNINDRPRNIFVFTIEFFLRQALAALKNMQSLAIAIPFLLCFFLPLLLSKTLASQPNKMLIQRNPFNEQKTTLSNISQLPLKKSKQFSPLTTALIQVHYAHAQDLAKFIEKKGAGLLSATGQCYADQRTNQIWIFDKKNRIKAIKQFIQQLDTPGQPILIKAKIVNVDDDSLRDLGLNFATQHFTSKTSNKLTMNLPLQLNHLGNSFIPLIKLKDSALLELQLTALEKEGHAQLISRPELITLDRQPAIIEAGDEIPYQEQTTNGNTATVFKKAVLSLKVIPEIMPNQHVLLHLTVNQDKVSTLTINDVPALRTQRIQTQVLVKDQETIILGGIFEQTQSQQDNSIPYLKRIPILGMLFRRHQEIHKRKELLIFVTPKILE